MKQTVYILYGGKSAEHDVSLKTAFNVLNRINKNKYNVYPVYVTAAGLWHCAERLEHDIAEADLVQSVTGSAAETMGKWLTGHLAAADAGERPVVFPLIHGTNGEDGTLQGLLELLDVPYVGSGVLSSAVGMDKVMMKQVCAGAGLPQADYVTMMRNTWERDTERCCDTIEQRVGYPCYVKPANLGSSVGISRCTDRDELRAAMNHAMQYDRKIIIEQEIVGREVQLAVIGNDRPRCSVGGEFVREPDFFDYNKKYVAGGLVQRIPACLSDETCGRLQQFALQTYEVLDGSGLMRVDFFVTDDDRIYLNEVNTLPGFTAISMFPALWAKTDGTTYQELLDELIGYALERHEQKQQIRYGREVV